MLHFKSIKKIHPPKIRKTRSSVSHTDIPPILGIQYWGAYHTNCAFSHSCILFSRNLSAPLLFILTDKIKNPKPLISKKFGISVWCRWRGSNPHDVAINGF